jgi:ribulose-5-phosphate 4-epimerase/fuculose-1-phosphate aldolase
MNNKNGGKERLYQKALQNAASDNANFSKLAADLAKTGRSFYSRGWVLGTSGNFSAVTSPEPLRLVISSTGLDNSSLTPAQFLEIDDNSNVVRGEGCPSAEALLHLVIVRCMNAEQFYIRTQYGVQYFPVCMLPMVVSHLRDMKC